MSEVLPKPPAHFYKTNPKTGLVEAIDKATGRVLAVQASAYDFLDDKFGRLVKIDTPEGPVYIEKGLSFDQTKRVYTQKYSAALADLICEKMVNDGATLIEAAKEYGVDYASICRWRRESEEFRTALLNAKKDRAEFFHDEAIEKARSQAKTAFGDKKLEISTLQWAAERGDAENFGSKTTIRGDKDAPLGFIIDTGIRREGDPGFKAPDDTYPQEEAKKDIELKKGEYSVE